MLKTSKKIAFVLLLITAVSSDSSNDIHSHLSDVESDPEMEKYLREAVENFRDQMKEGIPAINMPRLDPLDLRNLDINVNENLATMSLHIKQITVQDLSTFELPYINADLETFFLKLKLSIPIVQANGMYNLNGKLLTIFPLKGNGSFSINLTNAEISGIGKLVPSEDTLQMNTLDLALSWSKLDVFLENFLGGGRFSQVLQRMLPNIGKNIFESYKPEILMNLNTQLKRKLNAVLKRPEVKNIIQGILPP